MTEKRSSAAGQETKVVEDDAETEDKLPVGPPPIAETVDEAAKAAADEAEAAGVSPHAVMRSAPDGYATGLGDKWEGIHVPADKKEGNAGTGPDHPSRRAS